MDAEREWRCKECETLLGVERGPRLHLRYKQVQYVVDGGDYIVIAVCRNCTAVNERSSSRELPQPVATSGSTATAERTWQNRAGGGR